MKKVIYIDTETTGLDKVKHGMRELAYIIEVDGEELESGLFKINPLTYNKEVEVDQKALDISNKTLDEITSDDYADSVDCFNTFIEILDKYIDKFDTEDKFIVNGYNTAFDTGFIQEWFKDNNHKFYGSYFNYKELDVFALVKFLKYMDFIDTPSDKLEITCEYFNIELEAHNALDDIRATKELSNIITKRYLNIETPELIQNTLNNLETPDIFAELEEYCLNRDLNVSLSWQKMTNWSVEVYRGYKKSYQGIFYTDGHLNKSEAINVAIKHFKTGE
jgi:DNA polymerase-3 subunit epsilon